jgi:predicted DNA repair protein MutK
MKSLSILGTAAMFLVGGGIVTHGIPWLHHLIEHAAGSLKASGGMGAVFAPVVPSVLNGLCGLIAGILVLLLVAAFKKLRGKLVEDQAH